MSALAIGGTILYAIWLAGFVLLKGGTNREFAQVWEASLYVAPVLAITVLTIGAWAERRFFTHR